MTTLDPATTLKILREPTVYLVGRQVMESEALDRFLTDHDVAKWETDTEIAGERLTEVAGRVCYMSFAKPRPGGNQAYLEHILEVGHGSVLEHAVWNFVFVGVSRSLTHELVRHRAGWSFSQLSQRYVDESVAEYVEPDCIASDPDAHRIWLDAVAQSHQAYVKLAEVLQRAFQDEPDRTMRRKLARQAARSVLPNATETKIFVTVNARALRNFIELRASRHAEVEIRKLAVKVLELMQKEAPHIFGDYQLVPLSDGTQEAVTPHRKV
jgi:thymidylate synthase (FAD)